MGKQRPSGDGMVRKREDGRWEGRIVVGRKENGSPIFRFVYAKTQKELLDKLRQLQALIDEARAEAEPLKNTIKAAMGDQDSTQAGEHRIT